MVKGSVEFFTIVAQNYLAYAYVLGKSIKRFHPNANFSIFLMDDKDGRQQAEIEAQGFTAIYPKQIDVENYQHFVFKYNVTEASTGVKPFIFRYLFELGSDKVIYLDPDILCMRYLSEVIDALDSYSIVLTPHAIHPVPDDTFPTDIMHLTSGIYNLGFIGIHRDAVTQKFLAWWAERLFNLCLASPEMGLFVDQKWIDLVPAYFNNVFILRNPAYNVAYWNLHERQVCKMAEHSWHICSSQEPVAFFHFSGISIRDPQLLTKYITRSPFNQRFGVTRRSLADSPDLSQLFHYYINALLDAKAAEYSAIPYTYNYYENGEMISQLERSIFFASSKWQKDEVNPFSTTSNSFWDACRRNGIRKSANRTGGKTLGELDKKYGFLFAMIRFTLRLILLVTGPDNYAKFARYMREQLLLTNHNFLIE